jgi:hypothetical protein|tara:strand:+ start:202 stop:441 length:240 start_codon:yes stop_codon:yes gene_type:complete
MAYRNQSRGTYSLKEDNYDLNIYYEYYWDDGDYETPPENDLEILEVELNGVDITHFFWDWVNDDLNTRVWEHAQENKHN